MLAKKHLGAGNELNLLVSCIYNIVGTSTISPINKAMIGFLLHRIESLFKETYGEQCNEAKPKTG